MLPPGFTLSFLPFAPNVSVQPSDAKVAVITKIDELLEQFVGIRDQELSTTIHDLAKAAASDDVFAGSLDAQLADFEFPDDFVLDVRSYARPGAAPRCILLTAHFPQVFELVHRN
jgi:hypothetical protein